MSHKSGHIIIQNSTQPTGDSAAVDVVTSSTIELSFPAGMELDARIAAVRHAMKAMDKLDHPDED